MAARGTPAIDVLIRAGVPHRVHAYEARAGSGDAPARASVRRGAAPGYGEAAAAALGVAPDRIFKTLIAEVDGTLACAVVPVAMELDLRRLAAALGGRRATLADAAAATRATGYVVGGISPLGQRRTLPTVVDASVHRHPTVYVSAGRRGLQVELAPGDLLALTGGAAVAVGRGR